MNVVIAKFMHTNRLRMNMESRIHGDVYVRFGGEYVETCRLKGRQGATCLACKTDKKGNLSLSMNVMGTGISARVNISMPKGTNKATVEINPNFNSNRMTLNGVVLPIQKSSVFKGRSL